MARSTKPDATQPSSSTGTCLSASEYETETAMYATTATLRSARRSTTLSWPMGEASWSVAGPWSWRSPANSPS
jgi:hypothetical protein